VVLRDERCHVVGVYAQPLEDIERGGLVTRRYAEQHPTILPAAAERPRRMPPPVASSSSPTKQPRTQGSRPRGLSAPGWEDGKMTSPLVRAYLGDRPAHTPVWFMRQAGRSLPEYRELRVGTRMLDACLDPALAA